MIDVTYLLLLVSIAGAGMCWEGWKKNSKEKNKEWIIFSFLTCLFSYIGLVILFMGVYFNPDIVDIRIVLALAVQCFWIMVYTIFLTKANKLHYISDGRSVVLSIVSAIVILFYPVDCYIELLDASTDFVWIIPGAASYSLMFSCYLHEFEVE